MPLTASASNKVILAMGGLNLILCFIVVYFYLIDRGNVYNSGELNGEIRSKIIIFNAMKERRVAFLCEQLLHQRDIIFSFKTTSVYLKQDGGLCYIK